MTCIGTSQQKVRDAMTTFDDREKQFEAKFQHDEQLKFKVSARRNRLLGEWAGALLGKDGEALVAYAKEVVISDLEAPGDDDVLQKVYADLKAANLDTSERQIRKEMDGLLVEAKKQVMAG